MDQSAVSISDSKVPTMMTTSVRFGLVACLVGFLFVACGGNPTVVGGKDDYDAPIGTAGEAPDGGPGIDINVGGENGNGDGGAGSGLGNTTCGNAMLDAGEAC